MSGFFSYNFIVNRWELYERRKKMRVYFDYAGTCPMDGDTIREMGRVMGQYAGNPSSVYLEGQQAARLVQQSREKIASAIDGSFKNLFFTGSGTESACQAIFSAAMAGASKGKKHLIASAIEHACVIRTLEALTLWGFEFTLIPVDNQGLLQIAQLEKAITNETCLVSVMLVNNEVGSIQDVGKIQGICAKRKVLFHCDGTQAIPHQKVSMKEGDFDYFSFSAHKFGGPKGMGCLYVKDHVPLSPLLYGGKQERGMRAGTENVPGIVGCAYALGKRVEQMESFQSHLNKMHIYFCERIKQIKGARIISPSQGVPGIINVAFRGIVNNQMVLLMDQAGIAISNGSACEAGAIEMSHVLLAMGLERTTVKEAVRFSFGAQNTLEEVKMALDVIEQIVERMSNE